MSQVRSPFYYFKFSCVYLFILFTYLFLLTEGSENS